MLLLQTPADVLHLPQRVRPVSSSLHLQSLPRAARLPGQGLGSAAALLVLLGRALRPWLGAPAWLGSWGPVLGLARLAGRLPCCFCFVCLSSLPRSTLCHRRLRLPASTHTHTHASIHVHVRIWLIIKTAFRITLSTSRSQGAAHTLHSCVLEQVFSCSTILAWLFGACCLVWNNSPQEYLPGLVILLVEMLGRSSMYEG